MLTNEMRQISTSFSFGDDFRRLMTEKPPVYGVWLMLNQLSETYWWGLKS